MHPLPWAPKGLHVPLWSRASGGDAMTADAPDICGLCQQPGADKVPHPHYWPGELRPDEEYVHADCEAAESQRACDALTPAQRAAALRSI